MMKSSGFAPKLGSLFSGSGGFELAGTLVGITPVWASEIEPFAIKVTAKRFPEMAHLGDITAVDGAKIEPVDVITFGSPCQGLSVAGLQKGLKDERSGLFLEAIRIIKEMRLATNGEYPTYAVWESVPGAFSSNKGEDFYKVIEEMCGVGAPDVSIPRPEKRKGAGSRLHWRDAGNIMGNGYSLAWRCLDAQFWGVPQRRKRIFLVADFGGQRAAEILFKREGLSRYFTPGKNPWQGAAGTAEMGAGAAIKDVMIVENHAMDNRVNLSNDGVVQTLTSHMGTGGGNVPMVMQAVGVDAYNLSTSGDVAVTLTANSGGSACHSGPTVIQQALCIAENTIDRQPQNGGNGVGCQDDISYTLNTVDRHAVCYSLDRASFNQGTNAKYDFSIQEELAQTLVARGPSEVAYENRANLSDFTLQMQYDWIIRRLTPPECAGLQGFPKLWCADIPHADAPEYKMWGNGVALPCVLYVMEGIAGKLGGEQK